MSRSHDFDRVRAELAAFGEEPLSPEEADLLAADPLEDPVMPDSVRFVEALADLANEPDLPLSEIEAQRAWRRVEAGDADRAPLRGGQGNLDLGERGDRGRLTLLVGAVALAAAAAVALVTVRPLQVSTEVETAAAEVELLGEQARAGLLALGVEEGSASRRAQELEIRYARRLGGGEGPA